MVRLTNAAKGSGSAAGELPPTSISFQKTLKYIRISKEKK